MRRAARPARQALTVRRTWLWAPVVMSNSTSEPDPDDVQDQDAEPSLNAPEEGRPDGVDVDEDESETHGD